MIALGLTVEFVAVVLVVAGLLMESATSVLWLSIAVVLVGLAVTALGVRRARPPRNAWVPHSAGTSSDDMPRD